MTILSRPSVTTSHIAWELIAGGTNNFLVQKRTQDGLDRNKNALHRATHKATDLTQFRIIYSNIEVDFAGVGGTAAITPRASSVASNRSNRNSVSSVRDKDVRLTVAVAETREEIMRDWEEVKECWRRAEGVVNMSEWENFYQGIIRIRQEEAAEDAASPRDSIATTRAFNGSIAQEELVQEPGLQRENSGAEPSPLHPEPSPTNDSANASFSGFDSTIVASRKEDTAANANHHSGCTEQEVWAARLVGAWLWTDAYQSILMLGLFLHGYYARWLTWWTAMVILYLGGLTLPRYHRPRFEDRSNGSGSGNNISNSSDVDSRASASLGMSGDEIRALVESIHQWQGRLGIDSPRAIQSKMASILLVNYSMSVFIPGGLTLRVIFEETIGPIMVVSLLLGALYVTLLRKRKPAQAHSQRQTVESQEALAAAAAEAATRSLGVSDQRHHGLSSARDASPLPLNPETNDAPRAVATRQQPLYSELVTIPLKLHHSGDWKFKSRTDGVLFEEMSSPYCNKKACRFSMTVSNATCAAMEKMLCDDLDCNNKNSYAYKFDTLLSGKRMIRRLSDKEVILQSLYKSPFFGIAPRDMVAHLNVGVFITSRKDQEMLGVVPMSYKDSPSERTGVVFVQSCIDHGKPSETPETKGFCRGAVHVYLAMGQEEEDGSLTLTLTMSVDPQGSIPASIVEATNAEQVKKLQIMRSILHQIGPIKKDFPPPSPPAEENNSAREDVREPSEPQQELSLEATISGPDEVDDSVRRWVDLFHNKHWALQQNKDGVAYYLTQSPWCQKKAVRVQTFVPGVKAHALDQVLSNPDNANKYDRLLKSKKKLRDLSIRSCLIQTYYASPFFGVKARDFVVRSTPRTYLHHEQLVELGLLAIPSVTPGATRGNVFLNCSIDAGTEEPEDPAYARGAVHCHGMMALEEVVDGSVVGVQIIQCTSVDPCGSIPNNLVNASNAEQIEKIKIIGKLMKSVS